MNSELERRLAKEWKLNYDKIGKKLKITRNAAINLFIYKPIFCKKREVQKRSYSKVINFKLKGKYANLKKIRKK